MATPQTIPLTALGAHGDPCGGCGGGLAEDQRYCLNCGRRRGPARVTLPAAGAPPRPPVDPPSTAAAPGSLSRGTVGAGAALVLGALLIGVVIGDSGDQPPQKPISIPAQKPPVVNIQGGAGAAAGAGASAGTAFTSDWPEGKNGYTVQLQALAKDGTQPADVDSAKSAAESKGAKDVGALDSDDYASLAGGKYVVYSGVFSKKGPAAKALAKLKKKFKKAKVVKVSTDDAGAKSASKSDLQSLDKLSPEQYQKKSKKLPDKLKLPGKAPKKDTKKPGDGTKQETIG